MSPPAARLAAAGFSGEIVTPEDPGYDELRKVWNVMIERQPALIARCTGPNDVAAALSFPRRLVD